MPDFDAIVIGAGQAGPSLALRLAGTGMKVAIIERGAVWWDVCKYRLHSDQSHGRERLCGACGQPRGGIRRRNQHACDPGRHEACQSPQGPDFRAVKTRPSIVGLKIHVANCTVYQGHARFESANEISVGDVRLTAGNGIFINVGARAPVIPPIPGLDQVPFTSPTAQ